MAQLLSALLDEESGGLSISTWAVIQWAQVAPASSTFQVTLPSGRSVTLAGEQYRALVDLLGARWEHVKQNVEPDHFVLEALPGDGRWIGRDWIREVLDTDADYVRYVQARRAFETEVDSGMSPRAAWERASARLRGLRVPERARPGRRFAPGAVPRDLWAAFVELGPRAGLRPATAKSYRAILRRIFEFTDGLIPSSEAAIARVLEQVASDGREYTVAAPSAWAALCRAAQVDGIELPLPTRA